MSSESLVERAGPVFFKNENEEKFASSSIALAVDIKKRVPKGPVSGIVFRADWQMQHKIRRKLLTVVEVGVNEYDIDLIPQDIIAVGHLDKWWLWHKCFSR